ncbi:MAG: hypothetical protein RLO01_09085 [Thalassobaculaceae bacterium]|uniref:hypothetical protein n=1 Tax=Roseitalea porphyridii TaxID=1852022 RepID=UPI0032ECCA04
MIRSGGARAEHRRRALRRFIDAHNTNPREMAVRAGFKNANAIYNFLAGRSLSLSTETYEALVATVPGATMADILGEGSLSSSSDMCPVTVKSLAEVSRWRESADLLPFDQFRTAFPIPLSSGRGAFGLRMGDRSMSQVYPRSSLLLARTIESYDQDLDPGVRLVLHRFRSGLVEVSVRELVEDTDGGLGLTLRSDDLMLSAYLPLGDGWREGSRFDAGSESKAQVTGVIVGCFIPELDLVQSFEEM